MHTRPHKVEDMTLHELLKQHGIHTIADLTHRTGLSKQYGWLLWHGKVNIGLRMAKRLSESLSLPYTVFLDLERPVPPSTRPPGRPAKRKPSPNGRPRKRKEDAPGEGTAHE
jgi:transcriptional regulator with XRE-family HTH domain